MAKMTFEVEPKFRVGQRVEWHMQWPWKIVTGEVVAAVLSIERANDVDSKLSGNAHRDGLVLYEVRWDPDQYGETEQERRGGYTTFVPEWNERLRAGRAD